MQINNVLSDINNDIKKLDKCLYSSMSTSHPYLQNSLRHLLRAGGKRLRPILTLLSASYGRIGREEAFLLATAFELMHMASLVHDDIIDNSELRRGKATINKIYGNDYSLHFGDCLLSKALSIVYQYHNPHLNMLVTNVSLEMSKGEIEQISAAYDYHQNIKKYFYLIKRKTALMMSLSCQGGALAGGSDEKTVKVLGRYGHYLGMAFQITDDVLDYIADEKTLGKPVGSDLQQGIITLPLIYILKYNSRKEKLQIMLEKKRLDKENIEQILQLVKETAAIPFSLNIANRYIEKSLKELNSLPDNQTTQTLRKIALFIKHRTF